MINFLNHINYIDSSGETRVIDSSSEFKCISTDLLQDFKINITTSDIKIGVNNTLPTSATFCANYIFGNNNGIARTNTYQPTEGNYEWEVKSVEKNFICGNGNNNSDSGNNVFFGKLNNISRLPNGSEINAGTPVCNFIGGTNNDFIESEGNLTFGSNNVFYTDKRSKNYNIDNPVPVRDCVICGQDNSCESENSLIFGENNIIKYDAPCSVLFGSGNIIENTSSLSTFGYSNLIGNGLIGTAPFQTIFGTYNSLSENSSNAIFSVGSGYDASHRKNSLTVYKNGETVVNTPTTDDDSRSIATKEMFVNNLPLLYAIMVTKSDLTYTPLRYSNHIVVNGSMQYKRYMLKSIYTTATHKFSIKVGSSSADPILIDMPPSSYVLLTIETGSEEQGGSETNVYINFGDGIITTFSSGDLGSGNYAEISDSNPTTFIYRFMYNEVL